MCSASCKILRPFGPKEGKKGDKDVQNQSKLGLFHAYRAREREGYSLKNCGDNWGKCNAEKQTNEQSVG